MPIDSDPAAEEDSYDPFSSGNGGKKPNDVMESEEVLELGDGKPNQQPPYTPPPPPPYYPPQPIYYPPQEQKLPPLPPLPNFEKRKPDPREDNLALDAALNQAIDSKLMNLAENSEEVETPGARKRRELRAAIREALKKLRDSSIERRSPEHVSIADMFAYMRGLCNYLPQPKKSLFLSSEERVELEYVINRLKSSPGLFNETTEVSRVIEEKEDKDDSKEPSDADAPAEETETEAEDTKPSKEEISGTILCLQNMIEDNMDDKDLVSALNAKVRRVLARCDTEKLQL